MTPVRCVIDTNVLVTANGGNDAASPQCVAACARAVGDVHKLGHVVLDQAGEIITEYRNNLTPHGEPHVSNLFLRWLMTNEYNPERVTRVRLTAKVGLPHVFEELPAPPAGITYDPSDCKFLAVSAADAGKPPILQALDSKWWGWTTALAAVGITVHFLCPDEIKRKHAEKTGE